MDGLCDSNSRVRKFPNRVGTKLIKGYLGRKEGGPFLIYTKKEKKERKKTFGKMTTLSEYFFCLFVCLLKINTWRVSFRIFLRQCTKLCHPPKAKCTIRGTRETVYYEYLSIFLYTYMYFFSHSLLVFEERIKTRRGILSSRLTGLSPGMPQFYHVMAKGKAKAEDSNIRDLHTGHP